MTKRIRRRNEFRELAVEYVSQVGEAEINAIVRCIQARSRCVVERSSLGVILGGESRLERHRMTINGTYVTVYALP